MKENTDGVVSVGTGPDAAIAGEDGASRGVTCRDRQGDRRDDTSYTRGRQAERTRHAGTDRPAVHHASLTISDLYNICV